MRSRLMQIKAAMKGSDVTGRLPKILAIAARQENDLWSADWWQRGEGPPEFTCERDESEWWELGDEPDWDMAA